MVAALLLFLRRPDALLNPQFWATDATIFYRDAVGFGWRSLFMPAGGHLQVIPRLLALGSSWVAAPWAPLWFSLAALGGTLSAVACLFAPRLPFSTTTRCILIAALLASPLRYEVYWNLSSLQWFLVPVGVVLALARRPRSTGGKIFEAALLLGLGLTSQFALVLVPAYLWRWLRRRDGYSLSLLCVACAAGLIQLRGATASLVASAGGSLWTLISLAAGRLAANTLGVGAYFTPERIHPAFALAPMAALAILVYSDAMRSKRGDVRMLLYSGGLAWVLAVLFHDPVPKPVWGINQRYLFLVLIHGMWALVLWRPQRPLMAGTLLGCLMLFSVTNYPSPALVDMHWPSRSTCLAVDPECVVPINPPGHYLKLRSFHAPRGFSRFQARFGDRIELYGYIAREAPDRLNLALAWVALSPMRTDYSYFVHVFDPTRSRQIVAQADGPPLAALGLPGFSYPTHIWSRGEVVVERLTLPYAGIPPGPYRIALGWYDLKLPAQDRLPAYDARGRRWQDDRVVLPVSLFVKK